MRIPVSLGLGLACLAGAQPVAAATIVVFTNPETLERRMIVVHREGPDLVIMCMLPPGEAGCHQLKQQRS